MASSRPTKITEYLRHEFTQTERLDMGSELAQAHNRLATIEEEESVMKSQIKERKSVVEQSIGTLSRNLGNGFEMRNIVCTLEWDKPNVGEVSYRREDNGQFVKARAMNAQERQMDLPLETETQVEKSVEKSSEAANEFFKPGRPAETPTAGTAAPVPLEHETPAGPVVAAPPAPKPTPPTRPKPGGPKELAEHVLGTKSGPKELAEEHAKQVN